MKTIIEGNRLIVVDTSVNIEGNGLWISGQLGHDSEERLKNELQHVLECMWHDI